VSRKVMLSAAAMMLVSCGGPVSGNIVNLDQPFLLCSGESVKVLDADLEVEATSVIDGLDGSMEIGVGSVYLLVDHGTEKDIEVYLETGGWKTLGEYELHFIEVTNNEEGITSARLLVR
jgi:hypothetical protein